MMKSIFNITDILNFSPIIEGWLRFIANNVYKINNDCLKAFNVKILIAKLPVFNSQRQPELLKVEEHCRTTSHQEDNLHLLLE